MKFKLPFVILVATVISLSGVIIYMSPPAEPPPAKSGLSDIDRQRGQQAWERAKVYLLQRQQSDGSWISEKYGQFKEGLALTPLVSLALLPILGEGSAAEINQFHKSLAYLTGFAATGKIDLEPNVLSYPVYTSALTTLVLSAAMSDAATIKPWADLLADHAIDEHLGWTGDEVFYGGWGFAPTPPRKISDTVHLPVDANLSATSLGLQGLANVGQTGRFCDAAIKFISRCQNTSDDPEENGGFYFMPEDRARNKAGFYEKDGKLHFHAYGSMTAAALAALNTCGLTRNDPIYRNGLRWMQKHFDGERNPGNFVRESSRMHTYFYYIWSLSRSLPSEEFWHESVLVHLLNTQNEDGSWTNPAVDQREDDPLVATPMAMEALRVILAN